MPILISLLLLMLQSSHGDRAVIFVCEHGAAKERHRHRVFQQAGCRARLLDELAAEQSGQPIADGITR